MTHDDRRHGQDSDEISHAPIVRDEIGRGEEDDGEDAGEGEEHAPFEFPEHFGHFDEKV